MFAAVKMMMLRDAALRLLFCFERVTMMLLRVDVDRIASRYTAAAACCVKMMPAISLIYAQVRLRRVEALLSIRYMMSDGLR